MPYELKAIVAEFGLLRSHTVELGEAVVAPLRQRMGLVPVTGQLLKELTGSPTSLDSARLEDRPITMTPPVIERTLRGWSRGGPIGYVDADFHGGLGDQTAALWQAGARVWGPTHTRDFTGPRKDWPINAVLSRLGVVLSSSEEADWHDLFLEVGLGWEQDMEGWQLAGRRARWATDYDEWHEEQLAERRRRARAAEEAEKADKLRRLPGVPVMLNGKEIMELLGISPGPLVGAATRHLQDLHLERDSLSREEAVAELRTWVVEQEIR